MAMVRAFGRMLMRKAKLVGLGGLALAAVIVFLWQQQRCGRLAGANAALRSRLVPTAQLSEENQRLAGLLKAADARARSEYDELLRLRAAVAGAKSPGKAKSEVPDQAPAEDWRQRFEAVYSLRGGEVLRRIAKPFIPERAVYCRQGRGDTQSAAGYIVFRQDAQGLHEWSRGHVRGQSPLESVLRYVLGLKRYEFDGANELLALPVPGDWVIRAGAAMDLQLAALEPILRAATGRSIRFEKQAVDNDVIIVRGILASSKEWPSIQVFAEKRNVLSGDGGGGGTFQQFLERLGDRLNVPFASEAQLPNQLPIHWTWHADSDFSRAGERQLELLNKILDNLQQQTALSFELQRRPGEIWLVKE